MTRVKICGITNAPDRDAAVRTGADALGFISGVTVDTSREIDAATTAELIDGVPPFVTTVLVTMPDSVGEALDRLDRTGADAIQIHAGLGPEEVEELTAKATVIRAVDATNPGDARAFDDVTDALLVDSTDAAGGGGTGRTHDWEATHELRQNLDSPLILAGGLTPENVREAVRVVGPHGVDVATGVEREGGKKDHDALESFVTNARRRGVCAR